MDANVEELKLQVANLMARVSMTEAQIAEMDDDMPEQAEAAFSDDSTATHAEYSSFFKVVDASTPGTCKIGVTDGGHGGTPEHCGTVYLNGVAILIDVFDKTVASAGMYWVWLHSWISAASGEQAEIIVGAVDVEDSPDNPNGGVAFASQLLGRVTVAGGAITAINQDYLRGGEHVVYLWGDCDGFEQS